MKLLLTFPPELTDTPVTYNLIKDYNLKTNILRASIEYNVEGRLLLELIGEKDDLHDGINFLKNLGIKIDLMSTKIVWNEDSCVHCGACTALCPSGALSLDRKNCLVSFDESKCLGCELCVKACPRRCIESCI